MINDTKDLQGFKFTLLADNTYSVEQENEYFVQATKLVIPSEYNGKPITKIGFQAFNGCESLISVEIPNSVIIIDEGAFLRCESLTSITIPENVTTIGTMAFAMCRNLKSIELPNSLKVIGDYAFDGCRKLKIIVPNNGVNIGECTFGGCKKVKYKKK